MADNGIIHVIIAAIVAGIPKPRPIPRAILSLSEIPVEVTVMEDRELLVDEAMVFCSVKRIKRG